MTAITRAVNAGTTTAIGLQHTQPYHICDLVLPTSGTQYLSEGPQLAFDNGEGAGSHNYLEGRIRVGALQWDADGNQSCQLEILDDASHNATTWFLGNKIGNATVRLWIVYRNSDGNSNTPMKYAVGSCDSSDLEAGVLRVRIITTNSARKFFPNTYIGPAMGAAHLPAERAIVFWNNTTYVLEGDYS